MSVDWEAVQKAIIPIKDYEALCCRWQESLAYPFVRQIYNFTLPELADYTRLCLGGDLRARYTNYATLLIGIFTELHQAGVKDILDLAARVATREKLAILAAQSGVRAQDIAAALKYLTYWFIPMKKLLSGLVREDAGIHEAIQKLRELGVRSNLDLLQQGMHAEGRKALTDASGLPEPVILELVNRADFSRMPWASKATISNIIGAGYGSLAELARANPEQLYQDFFRYGRAIGKNLKLGNEIENSYRIAKIMPVVLDRD